jgi:hypothetical protein
MTEVLLPELDVHRRTSPDTRLMWLSIQRYRPSSSGKHEWYAYGKEIMSPCAIGVSVSVADMQFRRV